VARRIWLDGFVAFDQSSVRCTECDRAVDEFTTIGERWLSYYDERDLFPYCPPCAEREFAPDAPPSTGSSQRQARAQLDH
jgi:hypothetical protein